MNLSKFKIADCNYNLKIFMVPIILAIMSIAAMVADDYDYYFIIENGKKILEDGFPYYDWISMHEGLHVVIQQWIPSVIHYLLYEAFGLAGAYFFSVICWSALGIVMFFCCLKISKNNYVISLAATIFCFGAQAMMFATPRPQVFSALFTVLTTFVCWEYFRTKNKKLLIALPILALAQANFHSTFYLAIIGIIFSFLMFDVVFNRKNLDKTFLIVALITIPVGLLNPYGYEGVLQPFYTIGYPLYSRITELSSAYTIEIIALLLPSFAAILYCIFSKRINKANAPLLFLFAVTFIGALSTARIALFLYAVMPLLVASCFIGGEQKELKLGDKKKLTVNVVTGIFVVLLVSNLYSHYANYGIGKEDDSYQGLFDYFSEEGDTSGKTLLTPNISEGQFLYHYFGIRPYIDGRLETYISSLNKKADISNEFYLYVNNALDVEEFIEKYDFDYIIIYESMVVTQIIIEDLGYEEVYRTDSDIAYIVYTR